MICLDELASLAYTNEFTIFRGQLSQSEGTSNKFIKELEKAALKKRIAVSTVETKTQSNRGYVQHEHNIYDQKGFASFTVSTSKKACMSAFDKFSVFDTDFNSEVLAQNLLIFSEALVKVIYQFQDPTLTYILDNDSAINHDFVSRAKIFLQTNSRHPLAI